MALKPSTVNNEVAADDLIDKYIGTAYDIVLLLAQNLTEIQVVYDAVIVEGVLVSSDLADEVPLPLGTPAIGTIKTYAAGDHVHSDVIPNTGVLSDGVTATTQSDDDASTKVATTAYVDTASDSKVAETITEDVTGIAPSQAVVFDALALKAPLNNPTLTGIPAAPTPAADTETTQIATTAFVAGQIQDSISDAETKKAPSQNAVFDALALKAPLSGPALTDDPTAPTQATDDDSTKIATTAFVLGQANDATPQVLGTPSAGTSEKYLRADTVFSDVLPNGTTATTQANTDDSTKVATTKFVQNLIKYWDLFMPKGGIDCSTNPNFPAADAGHAYRVSAAGKIGGASGADVEINDILICWNDSTSAGDYATVGSAWSISQVNLDPGLYTLIATIVNDLTTGGTTVPLSAEMGKSLKGYVDLKAALAGAVFTGEVEMSGTDFGFVLNRMTTTQKNALTPKIGMQVYDTTLGEPQVYKPTGASPTGAWTSVGGGPSLGDGSFIRINPDELNEAITLETGYNGSTVGPVTIGTGGSVTIEADARWIIL